MLFPNHPIQKRLDKLFAQHPDLFFCSLPQEWKELRELTYKQMTVICQSKIFASYMYDKPEDFFVLCENLHYINPSLAIRLGVHFILFGGALHMLGSNAIHQKVLADLMEGTTSGCFAMTEIGHGSNVRQLETTATYDSLTDTLVIHTPDEQATKVWIGGGTLAEWAVVFVRLLIPTITNDTSDQGIHAILVPLKQNPSVLVEDMGAKQGLNGVDNAYITFRQARVPSSYLLGKYGTIQEGVYTSPIKNKDLRFASMLQALSLGRISIAIGSYAIAYKAYQIALQYQLQRRQFVVPWEDSKREKIVATYTTSLERFTYMSQTLKGMRRGLLKMLDIYISKPKDIHGYSSLLKVFCSWEGLTMVNFCREMCGGHGYLHANQLGLLLGDIHIYQTFEGDNTVLLQQGVKWVLQTDTFHWLTYNMKRKLISFSLFEEPKKEQMKRWLHILPEIRKYAMQYMRQDLGVTQYALDTLNEKDYLSIADLQGEQLQWIQTHQNKMLGIPLVQIPLTKIRSAL
jgi:alkylation response protein AidB-like acyl-CoA dehydrogenase